MKEQQNLIFLCIAGLLIAGCAYTNSPAKNVTETDTLVSAKQTQINTPPVATSKTETPNEELLRILEAKIELSEENISTKVEFSIKYTRFIITITSIFLGIISLLAIFMGLIYYFNSRQTKIEADRDLEKIDKEIDKME